MASVSSLDAHVEPSNSITEISSTLKAEYEAAVAAHDRHSAQMTPIQRKFDLQKQKFKRVKIRAQKLLVTIASHRFIYQLHKQYVISLSNSLLASNIALSSAPKPLSDLQALTHATLLYHLHLASNTLIDLLILNRRLQDVKEMCITHNREFHGRYQVVHKMINEGNRETDELHAKVVEAAEKIGENPKCEIVDGRCVFCTRKKEREARELAVDNAVREENGESGKIQNKRGQMITGKADFEKYS